MDVATIGGGPGGLYASLLLKREHPDWNVTVFERNPADVTYGWGIVLPNRTLENLQAADAPSHEMIVEESTEWEPFDLFFGGQTYRSSGHTFASMLRTDLLTLLQDRCRAVGVELEFECEIDDPAQVTEDADLVIAADGVNSETRRAFADELGTTTVEGETRFSWFGTHADFDALSHIFVENDDGIWCAHTYPGDVSTFIVDCDAETWANARLDQLSESEYLSYLEELFAEHLDGHELLSQVDRWQTFTTVKNDRWSTDNLVLIGDAAHTAHYSIGSGTTMAMEDAIALSNALGETGGDVSRALDQYERERRPIAESLQRAAEQSRIHFEEIRRYYDMEGIQFVMHHLTRSGRLTYDSMSRRDPDLVEEFERWFTRDVQGDSVPPGPPASQPLHVRDVTIPNRAVRVATESGSSTDGLPPEPLLSSVSAHVQAGAGLTMTGPLAVSADGRTTPASPGLYRDEHATAWEPVLAESETPVGTTLVHAGTTGARQPHRFGFEGAMRRNEAWRTRLTEQYGTPPHAFEPSQLGEREMDRVRDDFVAAARRADAAGFDYVQVHLGGDYLLGSFLSPRTNDREDEYAGDLNGRLQFPRSVVEAVREVWPDSKPLGAVLQATDWQDGGRTLEESFAVASTLGNCGVDLLAPVVDPIRPYGRESPVHGLANFSDDIRNETGIPTIATAQTTTPDEIDTLVGTARADLCTYDGPIGDL